MWKSTFRIKQYEFDNAISHKQRSIITSSKFQKTRFDKNEIIEKKNSKTIVNSTFCDDFCKRFDQFESAKCENHDHNDFSNFSMRFKQRCKDQIRKSCFTKNFQLKKVFRVRVSFKSKKRKANISCSNEFQIKKSKKFVRLLTTRN